MAKKQGPKALRNPLRGPFEQVTLRLRVQRGEGKPDLVSERPQERISGSDQKRYTDLDAPTLVTFDSHCLVDVDALLASGAIRRPAPKPAAAKAANSGEKD